MDVPERHPAIALLVFHLLFERQTHRLGAHVKHGVNLRIGAVVLQAVKPSALNDEAEEWGYCTYYQNPNFVAASQSLSISPSSRAAMRL